MAENNEAVELTQEDQEELNRVKKALSWNGNCGYDGEGPDDAFDIEEVAY